MDQTSLSEVSSAPTQHDYRPAGDRRGWREPERTWRHWRSWSRNEKS